MARRAVTASPPPAVIDFPMPAHPSFNQKLRLLFGLPPVPRPPSPVPNVPRRTPPATGRRHCPPAPLGSGEWRLHRDRGARCRALRWRAPLRATDGDRGTAREREDDPGPGDRRPGAGRPTMGCLHRRRAHPRPRRLGRIGHDRAALDCATSRRPPLSPSPDGRRGTGDGGNRTPPRGPRPMVRRRPAAQRRLRARGARRRGTAGPGRGGPPHATGAREPCRLRGPARRGRRHAAPGPAPHARPPHARLYARPAA